jgi:hypothetical protein
MSTVHILCLYSELHDFYSVDRMIGIIEKEKTTEGYVSFLETIFIYRLIRDKNINHILKTCEFFELGIFKMADYHWFLRLIKDSTNCAQLLENSSLQLILGYFYKQRITIKNTQPEAYAEYCKLVSDLNWRLQIDRLENSLYFTESCNSVFRIC